MATIDQRLKALEQEQRCKDPFPPGWPFEVPDTFTDEQIAQYKRDTGRKNVYRRSDPFLLEFYLGTQDDTRY